MNLEQQVVSLELAKKLKELEVQQKSFFRWVFVDHLKRYTVDTELACEMREPKEWRENSFAAYTVAELGEILRAKPNSLLREIDFGGNTQGYWSRVTYDSHKDFFTQDQNEANARAKALIWLIENGHIENVLIETDMYYGGHTMDVSRQKQIRKMLSEAKAIRKQRIYE